MELLKQSFAVYKARHGKYCVTLEAYLYMITRLGMINIYREIRNRKVNADKIDQGVLEMVSFGDNEDYKPIKGFNLQMPEEVSKSIKLMRNSRYKF